MAAETYKCDDCGEPCRVVFDSPLGEAGAFDIFCDACGWQFFVPEEAPARSRIEAIRGIVKRHGAQRIDGYLVDVVTASMLLTIYNALSRENKAKFGKPSLPRLVDFGWKQVA